MAEFSGSRAFIQALQFIRDHFGAFAVLVGTWAAIATALTIGYSLAAHPAGLGASIGDQLVATGKSSALRFVDLLPSLFGTLVIGVRWSQLVLLGSATRNPLRLSAEMATYFGRSFLIGLLSLACFVPLFLVGLGLTSVIGTPMGFVVVLIVGLLVGLAILVVIYARIGIVLPAGALDVAMTFGDAFDRTKGRTASIAFGLVLSYAVPYAVLIALVLFLSAFGMSLFKDASEVAIQIISDVGTFATIGIVAGFTANVYRALASGDPGGLIAKQFE